MNSAFERYVEAVSGLTNLTAAKAERVAKGLVRSGAAASDQIGDIVEDLMAKQRKNREALGKLVKKESERAVAAMGLVRRKEVDRLEARIVKLERQLGVASSGAKSTTKKASAKKSAAKKASAKKSAAKKSAPKKSTS